MSRQLWALALLSACAEPAVLDVEVRIEEVEIDQLTLKVSRGQEGKTIDDCKMPFRQPTEGTCPADDGEGEWLDPRSLHFILYGKPGTPLTIELEGRRLERSITTTATVVELPANEGERRVEHLTLVGLTRERFRCSYKVDPVVGGEGSLNPEEQTSLAVIAGQGVGAARVPIVSARGRLGKIRRTVSEEGCTLEYLSIAEPNTTDTPSWCHVSPGSLVVAPAAPAEREGMLAAATCATTSQARVKAAAFNLATNSEGRVAELVVPRARSQISPPVLADVIAGDAQQKEVVFIARQGTTDSDPVELIAWQPGFRAATATIATIPLPGVLLDNIMVAPVVVPTRLGDLLVISGGHGAWGVVRERRFVRIGTVNDVEARNLRGQAVIAIAGGDGFEIFSVHAAVLRRRKVTFDARGMFSVETTAQPLVREDISANVDLRLAVGSINADDDQEILVSQNGFAQAFGRSGAVATSIDLWGGTIPGEQAILLANLDRLAGAEIISVGLQSSLLQAADSGGRPLDGWPLSLSGQGGRRHVVISELDGFKTRDASALRDTEIVALSSDGIVEVITLGPGSYDVAHVPWPSATRSAAGPGAYVSEADPQVR